MDIRRRFFSYRRSLDLPDRQIAAAKRLQKPVGFNRANLLLFGEQLDRALRSFL